MSIKKVLLAHVSMHIVGKSCTCKSNGGVSISITTASVRLNVIYMSQAGL